MWLILTDVIKSRVERQPITALQIKVMLYKVYICYYSGVLMHPLHLLQKRAIRIVKNTDYVEHSEPICKDLRLLKMPDMSRFTLWKFYFKLMNNKLPPYFENMKPVLPRICDNYGIRRPSFHLPLIKHDFSEKILTYQLTKKLNENGSMRLSSKVFTHSFSGFSYYHKNVIIDRYIINCNVIYCVSCERVAN